MSRNIVVAAAQVGAIHRDSTKQEVVRRLIDLLHEAVSKHVRLVVFPECTLTTFFPRHFFASSEELDRYFEHGDDITQSRDVKPLFDEAKVHGIDIVVGYAERTRDGSGYNTSVYFSAAEGRVISKYRKVHLPGRVEPFADPNATNQLEKRYFKPGNLGFRAFRAPGLIADAAKKATSAASSSASSSSSSPSSSSGPPPALTAGKGDPIMGMLICNDRRWPEAWRSYTLQGAELLMFGYNTGAHMAHLWGRGGGSGSGRGSSSDSDSGDSTAGSMSPAAAEQEALFHSRLVQQANSYMNACFSIAAARCGRDDGRYELIGGSAIVSPEGHVVAEAKTTADELVVAAIDLSDCRQGKERTFDYARHRRIEAYGLVSSQTGEIEPELL